MLSCGMTFVKISVKKKGLCFFCATDELKKHSGMPLHFIQHKRDERGNHLAACNPDNFFSGDRGFQERRQVFIREKPLRVMQQLRSAGLCRRRPLPEIFCQGSVVLARDIARFLSFTYFHLEVY